MKAVVQERAPELAARGVAVDLDIRSLMVKADPEGEFFDAIVDEVVLRHIQDLPEDYRMAVILSDLEGLTYQEIAEMTEVPVGTVKSRLNRARNNFAQIIAPMID